MGKIVVKMTTKQGINKKEDETVSFLGNGISFDGKIISKGTMSIDGHFKGDASSIENLLVGENALIESNIDVSSIIIHGEIHGNIHACEKIQILSTGKVYGDVTSPLVVMEEGALLEGKCIVIH